MLKVRIVPVFIVALLCSLPLRVNASDPAGEWLTGEGNRLFFPQEDQPAGKAVVASLWSSVQKLIAPDGRKSDGFGYSVAISGNTMVAGAPYATVRSHYAQGAAYVFVKSRDGWIRKAKLTAFGGTFNDFFGSSVSIDGNTIVVGADGVNIKNHLHAGAAYVFVKPPSGWADMTQTAKLTASDEAAKAYLGSSIAIRGNTVAVGADGAAVGANEFQGAVYVFVKPAKGWASASRFKAKLTASDGARGDQLGYSLSMSGGTIVAGARSAAVGANLRQGAAYIFVKAKNGWASQREATKLTASDGGQDDQLGYSVAVDGDSVASGAPGASSVGAVYVCEKPAGGWANPVTFKGRLTASDGAKGDQLGYAVSIDHDIVVAGARSATVGTSVRQGSVYVFSRPETGWVSEAQSFKPALTSPDPGAGLGSAVGVTGHTIVGGAMYASLGSKKYQGAAYVFSTGPLEKAGKEAAASPQK